ncbi:MAG TPA: sigma-54 dependent transcriptional regulator [Acidobacteriota bacterium]|nr:sigma-54 dependent transcriptional regulator [Acidobacteriota bacterium]
MYERQRPRALVVDNDLSVCKSCHRILLRAGFDARAALSGKEALALLHQESFDIVFTDLRMLDMDGRELLGSLQTHFPDVVCVVITGYATVASVVEIMRLGAYDCLPKPFTAQELAAAARKAWERRKQILERKALLKGESVYELPGIVAKSASMQEVTRLVRKVAATDSTVLIIGENGTGKELIARAIHQLSPRRFQKFQAVDCGALSVDQLHTELFGINGALSAAESKEGIAGADCGGTVFLDEICNLSLDLQAKLLAFISERGSRSPESNFSPELDTRLIFATSQDLTQMVAARSFREDLYYRLCVVPIYLPPLRQRKEDIALLAHHLLGKVQKRIGKQIAAISETALRQLEEYDWPGNIRQLENVMEWASITCDGEIIDCCHLPRELFRHNTAHQMVVPHTNEELLLVKKQLREQAIAELERVFLLQALERNQWNISRAAREVGIKRQNFQSLMRKHRISPAR